MKNEIIIIESDYEEEWYGTSYTCEFCGAQFMADDPCYCTGCGGHIKGIKNNNKIVYNFD